jgi:hypothetical protein
MQNIKITRNSQMYSGAVDSVLRFGMDLCTQNKLSISEATVSGF